MTWPKQSLNALGAAYDALPGDPHSKARLRTSLLRMRIERVVLDLPPEIVHPYGDRITAVRYKLLATVGAQGLSPDARGCRLRIVWRAAATYTELCEILHGHTVDLYPPVHDLDAWEADIVALETELGPTAAATPFP